MLQILGVERLKPSFERKAQISKQMAPQKQDGFSGMDQFVGFGWDRGDLSHDNRQGHAFGVEDCLYSLDHRRSICDRQGTND